MKKRWLVLVALLLCTVTVLSSCGVDTMKLSKVVAKDAFVDENPTLTSAAELDVKGTVEQSAGDLVLIKGANESDTVYTVYDLAKGTAVYSVTDPAEGLNPTSRTDYAIRLHGQWDTAWFVVEKTTVEDGDTTKLVSLHDCKGNEFASAENKEVADDQMKLDLILFNGNMYRIAQDGSITQAFAFSALRDFPALNHKAGEYYYAIDAANLRLYDLSLNLITHVQTPSYAQNVGMFPLNNGDALIQYKIYEGSFAEEYTYAVGNSRYTLQSYILDAKKGEMKEVDLDYVVEALYIRDNSWESISDLGMDDGIENVALVQLIEDQRLDETKNHYRTAIVSNSGKIKGIVEEIWAYEGMFPMITAISNNRWIIGNDAGQFFLFNEKGDALGEVTGLYTALQSSITEEEAYLTAKYLVLDGKIYDWDLNVKYDLNANKMSDILCFTTDGVVFENEDGAVMMALADGSSFTLIATADRARYTFVGATNMGEMDEAFAILDNNDPTNLKCSIYNAAGTSVYTLEHYVSISFAGQADSNNAVLLQVVTNADLLPKSNLVRLGVAG